MNGDFVRRTNPDSTIDLICTRCFRTVATVAKEKDVARFAEAKRRHLCGPLMEWQQRFVRSQEMADQTQAKKTT